MSQSDHKAPFQQFELPDFVSVNAALSAAFVRQSSDPETRYSHYELNRYENIYIDQSAIPEVMPVCDYALQIARQLLSLDDLKFGFWFNAMRPGDRTARHNHTESDELLSAVYYIHAPQACGDLLIHERDKTWRIVPQAGTMLFFAPQLAHQVEENSSQQQRLSLAFNFGRAEVGDQGD